MKKFFSLLALMLLCSIGAWAEDVEVRPTFVSSSDTRTSGECASNLVDANNGNPTGTKWGLTYTNGSTTAWIIVKASHSVLKSYKLFNANDTNGNPNRRWKNWVIEGSNDPNGTWTEVDHRENQEMVTTNYAANEYTLASTPEEYSYYKITINEIMGNGMFQMSDLLMTVERSVVDVTFNVKNAAGEIVYTVNDESALNTTWNAPAAPVDYVTYNTTSFNVGTENAVFETTYQSTFPYQFSTTANPKWYTWKMRYDQSKTGKTGYLYYDATNAGGYVRETENTAKGGGAYYWALVGSEFGFKIINYAQGTGRYLTSAIAFDRNGSEFVATKGTEETPGISNVYFKIKGTSNYLNDVSGTKLGTWGESAASSDLGSQIAFEPVENITSYFDPTKVYTLKSNQNTYFKYVANGSTAASYQETPSYFTITQTNTGYVFTDIFDRRLNMSVWNVTTGGSLTWAVSPVDEETGNFYIAQHGEGSGGHFLGHRDNRNVGTGIYTDQPNPLLWTIEEASSYNYEYNVKVLAANGAVVYDGAEITNGNKFVSDHLLAANALAAKAVDGHASSIAVNADVVTVTYNKIGSYFTMENKTITLGDKTQTITPDTRWYVLSQIRGGETPAFDNGSAVRREAVANTVTALFTEGASATDCAKYLVRFLSTNVAGVYEIQFATGRYWNGVATNATATNAKFYHVHAATQTTSGQDQNGIAIINTTDLDSFGSRVDNDGAGNGFSYWGSGNFTEGTNNVYYIYPVDFTVTEEAITDLQEKVNAAIEPILAKEIGYPYIGCNEVTELIQYRDYGLGSPINNTNYDAAYNALYAIYNVSNINLPEVGKAYNLVSVHPDGKEYYVNYAESGLSLAAVGDDPLPESAKFYVNEISAGHYVLVTGDGNYLAWKGSNAGTNSNKGYTTSFDATESNINVEKMATGGSYNSGTVESLFGLVDILGNRDNKQVCFIVNNNGSFNQDGTKTLRFNGSHSTAWRIQEVVNGNSNIVKLTKPESSFEGGLNGKYVGTFSAPYAVELPEGVVAYTANMNGNNVTFEELGNVVPKNTGVVLYAAEANAAITEKAVPATENVTVEGTNLLVGTNGAAVTVDASVNAYIMAYNEAEGVKFFKLADNDRTIARNKAYLDLSNAHSNLLNFRFDFEDTLTGVEHIETSDVNAPVFDLQGRRVQNVQSGLYIVNGKKVIR